MIQVMLIDDDVPVVEYLRKLVPWESLDMTVCAEAHSAGDAVKRFEAAAPDILVTDIGLPDGDGIELARRFLDARPGMRVVFLTCHEEFHYVKEALRISADDYVVKDELNADAFADTLRRAADRLAQEREKLERIAYKTDLERNRYVLLRQFFVEWIVTGTSGGAASYASGILEQGKRLGVDWRGEYFTAGMIQLDAGDLAEAYELRHVELIRYAAFNIAAELSAGTGITAFPSNRDSLWLVANEAAGEAAAAAMQRFVPLLQAKLTHYLKVRSFCCVAPDVCELSGLGTLIQRTTERFDRDYFTGGSDNFNVYRLTEEGEQRGIAALTAKWIEALSAADRSVSLVYMSHIEQLLREAAGDPTAAKEIMLRCLQEACVRLGRPMPTGIQEAIDRTARLDEAMRLVRWYADRLMQTDTVPRETAADPDLQAINAYIHAHIFRNVTSIDIARHLHLNPSYFSRYFKKLTGKNFTDHVHLIKMEEAKRLLAGGETAEHTAYVLGYSDRAYFSKVFKKYVGLSPSEYKPRVSERSCNDGQNR